MYKKVSGKLLKSNKRKVLAITVLCLSAVVIPMAAQDSLFLENVSAQVQKNVFDKPELILNEGTLDLEVGSDVPDWYSYIDSVKDSQGNVVDKSTVIINDSAVDANQDGKVDNLVSGTYSVTFEAGDPTESIIKKPLVVKITNNAPEINLVKPNIAVEENQEGIDWLSFVTLSDDGEEISPEKISIDGGTVDADLDGKVDTGSKGGTVTYSISDEVGNTSDSAELQVTVGEATTYDKPQINLSKLSINALAGDTIESLDLESYISSVYAMDGEDITATADVDIDTSAIDTDTDGEIDSDLSGVQEVTYSVADPDNPAEVGTTILEVVITQYSTPQINLSETSIEAQAGDTVASLHLASYIDSIYAMDGEDITDTVSVSLDIRQIDSEQDGIIDLDLNGSYDVIYSVKDPNHPAVEGKATLEVVVSPASLYETPQINLSETSINATVGDTVESLNLESYISSVYSMEGDDITDTADVSIDTSAIDTDSDGILDVPANGAYNVVYTVADPDHPTKEGMATLEVVVDGVVNVYDKPQINLNETSIDAFAGDTIESLNLDSYIDSIYAMDGEDITATADVEINISAIDADSDGNIDSGLNGTYDVVYKVVDPDHPLKSGTATLEVVVSFNSDGITFEKSVTGGTGADGKAKEGDVLNYSYTIANESFGGDLEGVILTDPLDDPDLDATTVTNLKIDDVDSTENIIDGIPLGSISEGSEVVVTFDATAADTFDMTPEIDSQASVDATNLRSGLFGMFSRTISEDIADIEKEFTTTGGDFVFDKVVSEKVEDDSKASVGETLHYKYVIINTSFGSDLEDVVLTDPLDDPDLDATTITNLEVNGVASSESIIDGIPLGNIIEGNNTVVEFDVDAAADFDETEAIDSKAFVMATNYVETDGSPKSLEEDIVDIYKAEASTVPETPEIELSLSEVSVMTGFKMEDADWKGYIESVTDDVDTLSIDDVIVDDSEVDTDNDDRVDVGAGNYAVHYSVTDSDGNEGTADLAVTVTEYNSGVSFTKKVVGGRGPDGKAQPGDELHYSYIIENESFGSDLEDVILTDPLDDPDLDTSTMRNVKIDGISSSQEITDGMSLGNIVEGDSVEVGFDVKTSSTYDDTPELDSEAFVTATNYVGFFGGITPIYENVVDIYKDLEVAVDTAPVINLSLEQDTFIYGETIDMTVLESYIVDVEDDIDTIANEDVAIDVSEIDTDSDGIVDVSTGQYTIKYTVEDSASNIGETDLVANVVAPEDGIIFTKEVTGGTGVDGKALEGDVLSYTYTVENESLGTDLEGAVLTDPLDDVDLDATTVTNVQVDGVDSTENIIDGIPLGNISEGSSVVVTLDATASDTFDETPEIDSTADVTASNLRSGLFGIFSKSITEDLVDIYKDDTVEVSEAPVIELSLSEVSVVTGFKMEDADWKGYIKSVTDDVDTLTADDVIVDDSEVDTNGDDRVDVPAGEYNVHYSVTDSDGNEGTADLIVTVTDGNEGVTFTKEVTGGTGEDGKALEGDVLSYTYTVENESFGSDLEDVVLTDPLDDADLDNSTVTNVQVDGVDSTENIIDGISLGNISEGSSAVVTFDATASDTFDETPEIDSEAFVTATNYLGFFGGITPIYENVVDIYKDVTIEGSEAPVIELSENSVSLESGATMEDADWKAYIASVTDDVDTIDPSAVVVDDSEVDTDDDDIIDVEAGTYTVHYSVTDSDGNEGTADLTVNIVALEDGIIFTKEVTGGTGTDGKAKEGDVLTYTYTVENESFGGYLEGAILKDPLDDADLDATSVTNVQVDGVDSTENIIDGIPLGNISEGSSVVVTLDATASDTFDETPEIDSTADVTASNLSSGLFGIFSKSITEDLVDIYKDDTVEVSEAPVIELSENSVSLKSGVNMEDADWQGYIASVTDDVDTLDASDVIVDDSEVDTDDDNKVDVGPGTYTVHYSVTDSDSNVGTADLTVNIVASEGGILFTKEVTGGTGEDGKALEGDTLHYSYSVENESFGSTLEGVVLTDPLEDVDLDNTTVSNLKISGVDSEENIIDGIPLGNIDLGNSTLVTFDVKAADSFDETAEIDSTANVTATNYVDTTKSQKVLEENTIDIYKDFTVEGSEAPVIELSESSVSLESGDTMEDADWQGYIASVTDDVDTLEASDVVVDDSEVDTNNDDVIDVGAGEYTVHYLVTDSDSNEATADLTVNIVVPEGGVLFTKEVTGGTGEDGKALEGDTLHYSYSVENESFGSTLEGVVLTDPLDDADLDATTVSNLKISGVDSEENIIDGIPLGNIDLGNSTLVTFDVKAASSFDETAEIDSRAYVTATNYIGLLGKANPIYEDVVDIYKDLGITEDNPPVINLSVVQDTFIFGDTIDMTALKSYIVDVEDDIDTLTKDDVEIDVSEIDTNFDGVVDASSGSHTVKYTLEDSAGNVGEADLIANVVVPEGGVLFTKEVTGGTGVDGKALEGDTLHYSYSVENESFGTTLEGVVLKDPLDDVDLDNTTVSNLKISGVDSAANIVDGITLGNIDEGNSTLVTFDVEAASSFDETAEIDSRAYVMATNYTGLLGRTNSIYEDVVDIYKDLEGVGVAGSPVITLNNNQISMYEDESGVNELLKGNIQKVEDDVDTLTKDDVEIDASEIDTDNDDVVDVEPGDYTVSFKVEDSDGNYDEKDATVKVVADDYENQAPTISLKQSNVEFTVGSAAPDWSTYILEVNDDLDTLSTSDVVYDATGVDMNTVGTYEVKYSIEDSLGAVGNATLSVSITEEGSHSASPVITLYDYEIYLEVSAEKPDFSKYIESVSDDEDDLTISDVEIDESQVDNSKQNTYDVGYSVEDSDENIGEATLKVNVGYEDSESPVIDLIADEVELSLGDSMPNWLKYVDGVSDNKDDLTKDDVVIDDSKVDMSTVGTYNVFYSLTDSDNNTTVETLEANVIDYTGQEIEDKETGGNSEDTVEVLSDTATTSFVVISLFMLFTISFVGIDFVIKKNK